MGYQLYPNGRENTILKEAMFYRRLKNNLVQCEICPRKCTIPDGEKGFCRNKENRGGLLYSTVYGRPCTINITKPENAPLFHFLPGHNRLAIACVSCNLRCKYCQNWHISQTNIEKSEYYELTPEEVVEHALRKGAKSISFTYTEPIASYEYVYEISKLARENQLLTSIVSNGFINPTPFRKLLRVLDAVNIDLKSFSDEFYREVSSAWIDPVLKSLRIIKEEGVHLEIVNLIIPTLNDNRIMISKMCRWIVKNLGEDVPLHFTRFFPSYRLNHLPPTPVSTLEMAARIAQNEGLKYVYIGNVPGHRSNNTYCPDCGKLLVQRSHFSVIENNVVNGKCYSCGCKIPGIW